MSLLGNQPLTVLYVDDDAEDRLLFSDALKAVVSGWNIDMAADGVEALQVLTNGKRPLPSLLVVDLNMPRMGGKELIRRIKDNILLSSLPVVAFSTSANPDDRVACASYGVDMHTKPMTFGELKQMVKLLLTYTGKTGV
jgi:CheY-like chemotaxis protein